jgi:hypothetical protein
MTRPPSPLTMLFSHHTKRREFITLVGRAAAAVVTAPLVVAAQDYPSSVTLIVNFPPGGFPAMFGPPFQGWHKFTIWRALPKKTRIHQEDA